MPTGVPQRERPRTKLAAPSHAAATARSQDHGRQRDLIVTQALDRAMDVVTVPVASVTQALDRAMDVVTVPVASVGRVLSARTGLVRAGRRGVLAAADLMAWPVVAAAGLGSAVLSRWGPLRQPPAARRTSAARSGAAARPKPAAGRTSPIRSTSAARRDSPARSTSAAGRKAPVRSKPAARARSGVRRTGAV
jgi:hypothetical protein